MRDGECSDHVKRKRYIKSRGKQWSRELLADCAIMENEAKAFEMFYYQNCDIGYIADTLGWSYSATQKHIAHAARAIMELAAHRAKMV